MSDFQNCWTIAAGDLSRLIRGVSSVFFSWATVAQAEVKMAPHPKFSSYFKPIMDILGLKCRSLIYPYEN